MGLAADPGRAGTGRPPREWEAGPRTPAPEGMEGRAAHPGELRPSTAALQANQLRVLGTLLAEHGCLAASGPLWQQR